MTTTIVFAASSDGYVVSSAATYGSALAGPGDTADGTKLSFGQSNTPQFDVSQAGIDFDGSAVAADQLATTSYVRLRNQQTFGTGVPRNAELREFDWGASFDTTDFRTQAQLAALTLECTLHNIHVANINSYARFGQETNVNPGNSYNLSSSRNRNGNTPSSTEYNDLYASDASGTASDPALYYTTVPQSRLAGVLGAQAQLSDGTHVFLESSEEDAGTVLLRHHDGSSATTIATLSVANTTPNADFFWGNNSGIGMQNLTLVVDSSDNIYVIGAQATVVGP